ncbi:hypothetical protein [Streptomyces sp. MJM1172]|uniref:hypothetical protein n=1 Tax=Streptomyces sp. MJM1172 TaxID=1703926 RepID=UPI000938EE6E|nr:hypothetical protein [Streptomyces sp. MJM1172]
MPVPIPYVAAYSNELGPAESELCLEWPANGKPPHLAYQHPRPDDRDSHGNLWVRMTRPGAEELGAVRFDSMDPLRQRRCMEELLCQVCAEPAEREHGTLFIEWQHENEPPMRPNRITTDMPPVCPTCLPLSLRYCRYLRDEKSVTLLLVRKSVLCGVSGTLYRVDPSLTQWIPSGADAYSSFNKPRFPGMLAQRMYRRLHGVTVLSMDPAS